MGELMTVKSAAALVQVTPHTIYRWIKLGRLRPLRTPGGQVRFERGAVLAAIERYEYGDPGGGERDAAMG
jgi:excisionase family DNA binding protein